VPPAGGERGTSRKAAAHSLPSPRGRCRPQAAKEGQAVNSYRSYSFDRTGVPPSGGTTFLLVQKDGEERTRQREGLFTSALPSGLSSSEDCYICASYPPSLGPSLCSGLAVALQKEISRPADRALKWGHPLPSLGGRCRPQAAKEGQAVNSYRSYSFDRTGVPPSGGTTFLPVQKDGEERTRQREGLFTSALPSGLSSSEISYICAPNAPTLGPSLCSGLAVALQKEISRPADRVLKWGAPTFPRGKVPPAGGERGTSCKFVPQLFV
jgi:hypothetical protein